MNLESLNKIIIELLQDKELSLLASNDDEVFYPLVKRQEKPEIIAKVLGLFIQNKLTMGDYVHRFEAQLAKMHSRAFGLMFNSGSSALLAAFSAIQATKLGKTSEQCKEVLITSLNWSTPIFALLQNGFRPIFIDVSLKDLQMDYDQIVDSVNERTCGIVITHLMGNAQDSQKILDFARENLLWVVEDVCESIGAKFGVDRTGYAMYAGSHSDISCFSFYYSHQLSTIEGGMCLTNSIELKNALISIRTHGWTRGRTDMNDTTTRYKHIDPNFLFVAYGYNLRPTEIQGLLGYYGLDFLLRERRQRQKSVYMLNHILRHWRKELKWIVTPEVEKLKSEYELSPFAYYIIIIQKHIWLEDFVSHLNACQIENRGIAMGSYVRQPVSQVESYKWKKPNSLENSNLIMENGVYIGLHPKFDEVKIAQVGDQIARFFETVESDLISRHLLVDGKIILPGDKR